MMVSDERYKGHLVFAELRQYEDFYEHISDSIFSFPTLGTKAIANIDSYAFSSMRGTLDSMRIILEIGRINDAYALLRKFYDSAIINVYTNLYLQDNFSIDNFIVEKISNWMNNKEKLPKYGVMSDYLKASNKLNPINTLLSADNRYQLIRNRCNDHMHYNSYSKLMLNDNDIYLKNRLQWLDIFAEDIKNIFILHLAYVFYLKDHYMTSGDYIDFLDCGMEPPEDSQYWVAPFVQEIIDKVLLKERPDIYSVLKSNSAMQLI
jgi:hypothetical protein